MEVVPVAAGTSYREATLEKQDISVQKSSVSQNGVDLFFHSSSLFYVQGQIQRVPSSSSKNPTFSFLLILQISENLFACTFLQYQSIAQKFIIRFRKADLIFPFHYFW